jgi:4-hydroxy-2-oxoglutarate aldolase
MLGAHLKGIFSPITTPFIDGAVAYEKLALNVKNWSKTGLKGFVVLGSNGEYPYLRIEEKRKVVRTVIESAFRESFIIVGTGCESTMETVELTNECAGLGADAALVVTPHYYGGKMDEAALMNHYTVVAEESEIPILLYNVTKFTQVDLPTDVVLRLSEHPNIIGIKDSNGNVSKLGEYLNGVDEHFQVLVGTAGALLGALNLGCAGGILALANVAPESCVEIFEGVRQGDLSTARDLQRKMIPVNKAVTATYGIPGLKAAMDMVGYFGGEPRLPLLPSTEKERLEIREILMQAGLIQKNL